MENVIQQGSEHEFSNEINTQWVEHPKKNPGLKKLINKRKFSQARQKNLDFMIVDHKIFQVQYNPNQKLKYQKDK